MLKLHTRNETHRSKRLGISLDHQVTLSVCQNSKHKGVLCFALNINNSHSDREWNQRPEEKKITNVDFLDHTEQTSHHRLRFVHFTTINVNNIPSHHCTPKRPTKDFCTKPQTHLL